MINSLHQLTAVSPSPPPPPPPPPPPLPSPSHASEFCSSKAVPLANGESRDKKSTCTSTYEPGSKSIPTTTDTIEMPSQTCRGDVQPYATASSFVRSAMQPSYLSRRMLLRDED